MLSPNGTYTGGMLCRFYFATSNERTVAVDMWSVGCILGEMINRKPMFPGTDFIDQLSRVFRIVRAPDSINREYVIDKDALKFLNSVPKAPHDAIAKFCPSADPQAIDLLNKLLCFNPSARLSVDQALAHPYFKNVEDEWGKIESIEIPAGNLEFAFEEQDVSLLTLKRYIENEVNDFKTQSTLPDAPVAVVERQCGDYDIKQGFSVNACSFHVDPKYRAIGVLGEGSYGVVCSALNSQSNGKVAIKKITPMAGDDWDARHTLREIRLMRYFGSHPNVSRILHHGDINTNE